MGQYHFDPARYEELMREGVPSYGALQGAVVEASLAVAPAAHMLELGTGTGVTARAVLTAHAGARLVGIDHGAAMLDMARVAVPEADLRHRAIEDPLPEGPFELVFSALAVHHLDGTGKADLFARVAGVLAPGGRFVLGDLIVPEDPADVVTPSDGVIDRPSTINEQLGWLEAAGLRAAVAWRDRDLAVLVGDRPT